MTGCSRVSIGQRGLEGGGLAPQFEIIGVGLVGWAGPIIFVY